MPNAEPPQPRRRFQFGLGTLLLIMLLLGILSAAFGGMLRGRPAGVPLPPGFYVVMTVTAPLAVLLAVSLGRLAIRLIARYRDGR